MRLFDVPLVRKFLGQISQSREFTTSAILHLILVAVFGTAVLFEVTQEPSDFQGEGRQFVAANVSPPAAPPPPALMPGPTFAPSNTLPSPVSPLDPIINQGVSPFKFEAPSQLPPSPETMTDGVRDYLAPKPANHSLAREGISRDAAKQIEAFTKDWGKGPGSGVGLRNQEFEFVAFIGQYSGGDWNSTVQGSGGAITHGSLPNLLFLMNKWSRDKITTNYRNVRAIKLDSDELFSVKPPFIFLTGRRDFTLTEKEVANLQKYVQMGGCIWGDSSVPGRNSRFDIAFRREMRRVIPDIDKQFEPLPPNHPIFSAGYFPEIKDVPPGLNFYQEPVYALKIYGEVAILYTANDYGDMWQIGLDETGRVDLRRDERNQYVAVNPRLWDHRFTYLGNLAPSPNSSRGGEDPPADNLVQAYKFGTNIVVHLLTRWDRVTASAPAL